MAKRAFNGQVHVRLSPETHKEIAHESFEKGTSISGIVAQSLVLRRVLRHLDPWRAIDQIRKANDDVEWDDMQADIADSIKAVRKKARG